MYSEQYNAGLLPDVILLSIKCYYHRTFSPIVVVVVVVFTLKAVPISTQYFLTSVLVQLTRTPSVVTG